jgi:hypothetical protein
VNIGRTTRLQGQRYRATAVCEGIAPAIFFIEDIKQLLVNYESGPACSCGARPFLKTLIERKLKEIDNALDSLEALRGELQALYSWTLALEGKTSAELMKAGQPTPSDAVFGGHDKGSERGDQDRILAVMA